MIVSHLRDPEYRFLSGAGGQWYELQPGMLLLGISLVLFWAGHRMETAMSWSSSVQPLQAEIYPAH